MVLQLVLAVVLIRAQLLLVTTIHVLAGRHYLGQDRVQSVRQAMQRLIIGRAEFPTPPGLMVKDALLLVVTITMFALTAVH